MAIGGPKKPTFPSWQRTVRPGVPSQINAPRGVPSQISSGPSSPVGSARPGESKMDAAFRIGGAIYRDELAATNPGMLQLLGAIPELDIVVVQGDYDHIDRVLDAASIPFTATTPRELSVPILNGAGVCFVNCVKDFSAVKAGWLRAWVQSGRLLITTDWALKSVVEQAFPGFIEHNGKQTGDECVPVVAQIAGHPFTRAFESEEAKPVWWLEPQSFPIKLLSRDVLPLLHSPRLHDMYDNGTVMASFHFGAGMVVHMTSHLYAQRSHAFHQVQGAASVIYTESRPTTTEYTSRVSEEAQAAHPDMTYGDVQSAKTTVDVISSIIASRYDDPENTEG